MNLNNTPHIITLVITSLDILFSMFRIRIEVRTVLSKY